MSLPPGFLDELRTRVSLTSVVGRKVSWDMRKSNQGKGDMWAPCPFHQEKTASFHVDDRKGFYYCFGCQAKGDAISFIKDTENVSFIEAVEILAGEAGMSMPARDPQAREKADHRSELSDVMEQAVRYFRMSLNTAAAAPARSYLEGRGLSPAAQERFDLGFALDDRSALIRHLTDSGLAIEKIIETGLCIKPDDGGAPYDRFRGRIMFPIRDMRGRCIAFGGRAMDPAARAKYLNSPETTLFDKGRSLYNQAAARSELGKDSPMIVAEGYMDVIALVEAGFGASVAPLGTAITEDQLTLMWRMHAEPIIALDGDAAGLRAAYRLIDLALPMLETGRALRFALMPQGQDPDDVIRQGGPQALQTLLDQAVPMVELMWQQATEGQVYDSPERKAALDKTIGSKIALIRDQGLRTHYQNAVKELRWNLFRPKRSSNAGRGRFVAGGRPSSAQPSTKASDLAAADDGVAQYIREAVIIAVLIASPAVIDQVLDDLSMLEFADTDLDRMLKILRGGGFADRSEVEARIAEALGAGALEKLWATGHVAITPCLRHPGNIEMARMTVEEELAKLGSEQGLAAELNEAIKDPQQAIDDTSLWRLTRAAEAKNRATQPDQQDKVQYDLANNGARINRDERNKLDALLEEISSSRTKR
ncbi:MAG: DNA primase [Paracoccaceae bacterium]|nr:DNA primase [Paracoccaceae bacterium]